MSPAAGIRDSASTIRAKRITSLVEGEKKNTVKGEGKRHKNKKETTGQRGNKGGNRESILLYMYKRLHRLRIHVLTKHTEQCTVGGG